MVKFLQKNCNSGCDVLYYTKVFFNLLLVISSRVIKMGKFSNAVELGKLDGAQEFGSYTFLSNGREIDYYHFTIDQDIATIYLNAISEYGWVCAELYDANGREMDWTVVDDGGDRTRGVLTRGEYYIAVDGYSESGFTQYSLATSVGNANVIDLGSTATGKKIEYSGSIDDEQDIDLYKFQVDKAGIVNISADGTMCLLDENLKEQRWVEGSSTAALSAGTYYIFTSSDEPCDYTFTITTSGKLTDAEPNDSLADAYDLKTITGSISVENLRFDYSDDKDLYKFTLTESRQVTISIDGETSYDYCDLLDQYGNYLTCLGGENLTCSLSAGTYYLDIYGYSTGNYSITIDTAELSGKEEPNDSLADAYDLKTITGKLSVKDFKFNYENDADYYKFTLAEDRMITFSIDRGDVTLYLYDEDGNELKDELCGDPIISTLSKGTYYIEVKGYDPGDYTLTITPETPPKGEPNNTLATAYNIGNIEKETLIDNLNFHTWSDVDFYKFSLTSGKKVSISVDSDSEDYFDAGIILLDADGNGIRTYTDECFTTGTLAAGTYFIGVRSYETCGDYNLTITPETLSSTEPNNSLETAYDIGKVDKEVSVSGLMIDYPEDRDYYKFSLSEEKLVSITADGEYGYLELFDSDGNDINDGEDSGTVNPLAKGTYYIKVSGGYEGTYTLSIKPETMPASEPDNSPETAHDLKVLGAELQLKDCTTDYSGDKDFYKFSITENKLVNVSVDSDDFEGSICICDKNGDYVSGSTGILSAGTYYIRVFGETECNYALSIATETPSRTEPNNSEKTAYVLGTLDDKYTVDGLQSDYDGDSDYYKFTITTPKVINISVNTEMFSGFIDLYRANYYYHWSEYTSEDGVISGYLDAGTYYICVSGDEKFDYTLTVDPVAVSSTEPNNYFYQAFDLNTLTGAYAVENQRIDYNFDDDYYKFSITDSWVTTFSIVSENFDGELEVYDKNSNWVASSYGNSVTDVLKAGTYYVKVSGNAPCDYSLTIQPEALSSTEPNDSRGTAFDLGTISGEYLLTDQKTDYEYDNDYYKFSIGKLHYVSAVISGETFHGYLYLLDENGSTISASSVPTLLDAGTYYVLVEGGYGRCDYDLTITAETLSSSEPNDSLETAFDLGTISGEYLLADQKTDYEYDNDYYKFTLDKAVKITVTIDSENFNGNLCLLDHQENYLDLDTNGTNILEAGTYYVLASGYSTCDYDLKITTETPSKTEPNNSFETAFDFGTVSSEVTEEGLKIDHEYDNDYYKFSLSEGNMVMISVDSEDFNGYISLFDKDHNYINSSYSSEYSSVLTAGTYYAIVCGYDSSLDYDITITPTKLCYTEPNSDFDTAYDFQTVNNQFTAENLKLDYAYDTDCYKFTISEEKIVTILIGGDNFNGWLNLSDKTYTIGGTGDTLTCSLAAGTYYLSITDYAPGEYDITITTDALPQTDADASFSTAVNIGAIDSSFYRDGLTLDGENDTDCYKFSIDRNKKVSISANATYWSTKAWLYDQNYKLCADIDDINDVDLTAGTYYLKVSGYYTYDYALSITAEDLSYTEPNGSFESAHDIGSVSSNTTVNGLKIDYYYDEDYYKFTIAEDKAIFISVDSNNFYGSITLFDENRNIADSITSVNTLSCYNASAGTYYVKVSDYNECDYDLTITAEDYSPTEPNGSFESAHDLESITSNITVNGLKIDYYCDEDYYKFTIAEGKAVSFSVDNDDFDGWIELYDAQYYYVNEPAGYLSAGTYYIKVSGYSACDYDLDITVDELPKAEPNNSQETAWDLGNINGELTVDGLKIDYDYDYDYYKFTVDRNKKVSVDIINDGLNAEARLLDEDGNYIASWYGSYPIKSNLDAGTYYIRLDGYAIGDYSIRITAEDFSKTEPNDCYDTAYDFGTVKNNISVTGLKVDEEYDSDYYKFIIDGDKKVTIDIGGENFNGSATLLDEYHNSITYSHYQSRITESLEKGTYYLYVYGYTPGDYDLSITAEDFSKTEPNDSMETAFDLGTVTNNLSVTGLKVDEAYDWDYYKFTIDSWKKVNIAVNGDKFSGYIQLRNAVGDYVYYGAKGGQIKTLAVGTYYIEVYGFDPCDYDLNITAEALSKTESNDTLARAYDLANINDTISISNLKVDSVYDEDYYKFTIDKKENITVSVDADNFRGYLGVLDENGDEINYSNGNAFTCSLEAGTYYVNVFGHNECDYTLTVSNKDVTAPVKPAAKADITAVTNKNVTVSATFSSDSVTKQYSLDNKNWKAYTSGVVMTANGSVFFRAKDAAGNISEVTTYKVSNIDKTAPAKPAAKADITAVTNKNVTVSATFSSDTVTKQYSLDNKNWKAYTSGVVMTANGSVFFRAKDAAGNWSNVTTYNVSNINKTQNNNGNEIMVTQKITGLTVKSATEKATVLSWDKLISDVGLDFYEVYVDSKCYKSKKNTITIKKLSPGTHTFRIIAIDKNDNEIFSDTVKSFNVKDATAPKPGKITVTQVAGNQDAIKIAMNGFSDNKGIDGYIIKVNGKVVEDDFTGSSYTYTQKNLAGKVNVEVIAFDDAGNKSKAAKKAVTIKDVTGPTKVTGLSVKSATEKAAVLTWNAAKDNVGVTGYEVVVNGKTYKSKTNSITVKKLKAGTASFTVYAVDKAKNKSLVSDKFSFEVADGTAPKAGKITVTQVAGNQDAIKIAMNGFSDNKDIDGYIIKVNGKVVEDDFTGNSYIYNQKNLAGKVNVEVIAFDAAGNQSKAAKKKITAKDITPPEKVTGLKVVSASEKEVKLSWNTASDNVGVTQYEVVINGKTYKSKTNSITIKKLKAGTHKFKVYAVDKAKKKSIASDSQNIVIATSAAPQTNTGGKTQNFGTAKFSLKTYNTWEDSFKDMAKSQALVQPLRGTDGNDIAQAKANTLSYFTQGVNFGAGDDKLVIPKAGDYVAAGVWFDGDINFGTGNNTLKSTAGKGYVDILAENIIFGNGKNSVQIENETYIKCDTLQFGDGGNTVDFKTGVDLDTKDLSFGAGNDTVNLSGRLAADHNYQESDAPAMINAGIIDTGSGNDLINLGKAGWISADSIMLGDGDDRINLTQGADLNIFDILDFGSGNDTLHIEAGAELREDDFDFGAGNDTLIIDGIFYLGGEEPVKNLENISGSGEVVIYNDIDEDVAEKFRNAGITVTLA